MLLLPFGLSLDLNTTVIANVFRQRAKWSFVVETIVISRQVNAPFVFVKVTHLLVGEQLFNYFYTAL